MRIGLDDIDPHIAIMVEERLNAPIDEFLKDDIHWSGITPFRIGIHSSNSTLGVIKKRKPSEDEIRSYELRKLRRNRPTGSLKLMAALGFVFIIGLLGLGIANIVFSSTSSNILAWITWISSWIVGAGVGIAYALRGSGDRALRRSLALEEMRAVFPLLTLTRAERVYCDTLVMLKVTEVSEDSERTMRETLLQLNQLIETARQMEQRRRALLPLLGNNVVAELDSEQERLEMRLQQTTDPILRQSLEQSLVMCRARLENAQAIDQGMERLKVQQEAITHTISTAQSSLARLQIVAEPQAEIVAQEIAETVTQMNQRAYAVEKAVEEVLTLRNS